LQGFKIIYFNNPTQRFFFYKFSTFTTSKVKDWQSQPRIFGYFGVMVPPVSVKPCHFERYYNYIKNYFYSFLKAPFLNDSPLRSILWDEFTILSSIASAIVPSPMISYQAETGIWDRMMVEDRL